MNCGKVLDFLRNVSNLKYVHVIDKILAKILMSLRNIEQSDTNTIYMWRNTNTVKYQRVYFNELFFSCLKTEVFYRATLNEHILIKYLLVFY